MRSLTKAVAVKGLSLSILFMAGCSQAPTSVDSSETLFGRYQVEFPAKLESVEPLKGLETGVLDNGMRYAILPNNFPEDIVSIEMAIEVGSFDEAPGTLGIAHFLEHMVFNGSENIKEGELDLILGRNGLSIGGFVNASTDYDATRYIFNLPSANDELLDTAFFVLSEMTDKALFDDDAIDRERGIIHSELRGRSGPATTQATKTEQFFFPKLLRTHRSPTGTTENLNSVVKKDFVDFYEKYYRPEHSILTITGPVDPETVKRSLIEYFGDWEPGASVVPLPNFGAVDENRAGETGQFYSPDISPMISMRWLKNAAPATSKTSSKFRDNLINSLAATAFELRYNNLYTEVQKQDKDRKIGNVNYTFLQNVDQTLDVLSLDIWPEDLESGLTDAVKYAVAMRNHIATETFTDKEFETLKEDFLSWQKGDLSLLEEWSTYDYTRVLSTNFFKGEVPLGRDGMVSRLEAELATITAKDIQDAFIKHDPAGKAPLVFVAKNENIDGLGDVVLDTWKQAQSEWKSISEAFPVASTVADTKDAVPFDYKISGVAGELRSRDYLSDIDVHSFAYKNNVKLNATPQSFGSDNIDIQIRFGRGKNEPDYVNAIGMKEALESNFINGGLRDHKLEDIFSAFPNLRQTPVLTVQDDAYLLSAEVSEDNLETQLEIMSAYFQAPAWRETAFQSFQDNNAESDDSPFTNLPEFIMMRETDRLVCPEDVSCQTPAAKDYTALKLADAKTSMARALESGHIEISVIGDVDVDKLQMLVAENFGNLPSREAKPLDVSRERKFGAGQTEPFTFAHNGSDDRALISVIWPAPDGIDVYRGRKLRVLRDIFYGKIFRQLREEKALTYSPSVSGESSTIYKDFGYVNVQSDVKVDTIDEASDVIFSAGEQMRRGDISRDEFFKTHSQFIENAKANKNNKRAMAELLTQLQGNPTALEDYRKIVSDYERISRDEIIDLSRKIFIEGSAKVIHILPE